MKKKISKIIDRITDLKETHMPFLWSLECYLFIFTFYLPPLVFHWSSL